MKSARVGSLVITLALSLILTASNSVRAESNLNSNSDEGFWNLSRELNGDNAKISFEVDSTWHLVEGVVHKVVGAIESRKDGSDEVLSITVEIPVDQLDTDSSMRDEKMRKVMAEEKFPKIKFESNFKVGKCTPAVVKAGSSCSETMKGLLTIRETSRPVELSLDFNQGTEQIQIIGHTSIKWSDFGVEDPSILIAKLDETVKIQVEVVI